MGWYAFECKARQAAHGNLEQAFTLWRIVFVLYITQALQGRIGHTNETEENSRARLCAKLKSHHFRTHMHTHPYPFRNPIKVAWIAVLFDFCPVSLLNSVHLTPTHNPFQPKSSVCMLILQSLNILEANFFSKGFPAHRVQLLMYQTPFVLNLEGYIYCIVLFFQSHECIVTECRGT